jgi:uncharacterized small protein (DUF1192 family)
MAKGIKLPELSKAELTPAVVELLEMVQDLAERVQLREEEIARLKDEIAVLKKQNKRPKIKPSKMDDNTGGSGSDNAGSARSRARKRNSKQTQDLEIHHSEVVKVEGVQEDWTFKGHERFVVQDLRIEPDNTCYLLEQWEKPDGTYVIAKAPQGGHYRATLVSYILHQYYHQQVTQPLLLEQLKELGFKLSAGKLSELLIEGKEDFHREKDELLAVGKAVSRYLQTDDTGARHQGKNGYCTYIGNDLFAWFESTESKSRINFLTLLGAEHQDYVVNAGALEYMQRQGLAKAKVAVLEAHGGAFANHKAWTEHLSKLGLEGKRPIAIATEGALMGSLLAHGLPTEMAIVSDDAGQFNVFRHGLCWIHAERLMVRIIPLNETHRKEQRWVREQIWDLYADLKVYKAAPNEALKEDIEARFDELCAARTRFATLRQALKRLHRNKAELLLVLEKPWLPIHNNLSESDIREYVKKRKISGSTRSDLGRRCRDTFVSLKKTCRKHGISFWDYLKDRVSGNNIIPRLTEYIRQAAYSRM